ncbi:hypothetical protein EBZ37_14880 [bacterium]|nr:hypothetical protein [bacterium]
MELEKSPLSAPIQKLEWEVVSGVPGLGGQRDFFRAKGEERQESWESLMGRLLQRLGESAVFSARLGEGFVPEKSVLRSLPELSPPRRGDATHSQEVPFKGGLTSGNLNSRSDSASFHIQRPTRLLKVPLPLVRIASWLRAASDSARSWVWEVEYWQGPERIETEWWSAAGRVARDYYRVRSKSGNILWVFQDLESKAYFLHGFFD